MPRGRSARQAKVKLAKTRKSKRLPLPQLRRVMLHDSETESDSADQDVYEDQAQCSEDDVDVSERESEDFFGVGLAENLFVDCRIKQVSSDVVGTKMANEPGSSSSCQDGSKASESVLEKDEKNFANEAPINALSSDILGKIFQHLDKKSFLVSRRICHKWRKSANDLAQGKIIPREDLPFHLKTLTTTLRTMNDYFGILSNIQNFPSLKTPFASGSVRLLSIEIDRSSKKKQERGYVRLFTPLHYGFFNDCGHHITRLLMLGLELSDLDILFVLARGKSLMRLDLDNCTWRVNNVPQSRKDELWKDARINLKTLQELRIKIEMFEDGTRNAKPVTSEQIPKAIKNFAVFLNEVLKSCSEKLINLEVSGFDIIHGNVPLSTDENGRVPRIKGIGAEEEARAMELFSKFKKMESLVIELSSEQRCFDVLVNSFPNLRKLTLHISGRVVNIPHLQMLEKYSDTLRELHLGFSSGWRSQEELASAKFRRFRLPLKKLEKLSLMLFVGHLDFLVGFKDTLKELQLIFHAQNAQLVFTDENRFFELLPELKKLSMNLHTYITKIPLVRNTTGKSADVHFQRFCNTLLAPLLFSRLFPFPLLL